MKTNKNIDRLFQEKLKDFEVSPPDNVWKGIENNLKINKPKSLFPLWLRIGSVAAILMVFTIGSINYFNSEPTEINDINNIVTGSDDDAILNENVLLKDVLNSTENGTIITEVENKNNSIAVDSENKNKTPKIDNQTLKKDILNSTENEILVAQTKKGSNKDDGISNKNASDNERLTNKRQINSKNNQQQNIHNIVDEIQLKNSSSNLKNLNSEIATSSNTLKQNASLLKKTNNLSSNKESIRDSNIVSTIAKNESIDNNYSTSSPSDKIAKNNTKESIIKNSTSSLIDKNVSNIAKVNIDENLTELKDKSFDSQTDSDKVDVAENTVAIAETEKLESLEELLAKSVEEETVEDKKKWSVASVFAPVAYNSFNTKGSPLDLQFENSPKQGSKTMSYGVKVAYKINKRLSLQSGVSTVNVGYEIGDVFISPTQQQGLQRLTNVSYSNAANILNVRAGDVLSNLQLETNSSVPVKGVLNQEFGYIEVPLELKYKLNNSNKLGLNLVGGFSTLFLNKNEVFVETSEFSSNLGEANNLNNVNFSGNLGIDVDYKINKNLYINVAPMLKIHTSTFSKNADNFKPYILGVYSGINYKF